MTEDSISDLRVGFIGLGALGTALAENVLAAGARLAVWNRSPGKADALAAAGAAVAEDPTSLAADSDILLSCLSDDGALADLLRSHAGFLSALAGKAHVSMSTLSPEFNREMAARHADSGAHYIAAPVLGRPDMVRAKSQRLLAAGPASAVDSARPLLEAISAGVIPLGEDPAAAAVIKLALNFLIGAAIGAMGEAFAFVEAAGGNPRALYEIATKGPFASPLYTAYGAQMLDGNYREPLFALKLGRKDLALFRDAAAGTPAISEALLARFDSAIEAGEGDFDWTGVYAEFRRSAGLSG